MDEILDFLRSEINTLRSLERLLQTTEVRVLWTLASIDARAELFEVVQTRRIDEIRAWVSRQKVSQKDYASLGVRELRQLAARRRIPGYQSLGKIDLLIELEEADARIIACVERAIAAGKSGGDGQVCPGVDQKSPEHQL